nr:unnamed protein product [Bacillus subtilis]
MLHWISLLCAGCLEMAGVALMNQYAKEKSVKWVPVDHCWFCRFIFLAVVRNGNHSDGNGLRGLDRNWHRRRGAYRHPLLQGAERRQTDLLYRVDFMLSSWFKNSVIN